MTERQMRATLRGAVRAGLLVGWSLVGFGAVRRFYINPADGPTRTYTMDEAQAYCHMLFDAGVEPVYRDSEPCF